MAALNHAPDRFAQLPFRKGEKDTPDWSVLGRYIAQNHSSNNTTTVDDAIKSMSSCHNSIVKTCVLNGKSAPNESFIDHTLKEYCALVAKAQAHLPLNGGKISKKLTYIWRDSFRENIKYESLDSNAELISCIYNLAASYSLVAVNQAQTGTVEGVKDAFNNFQNAAGYYTTVDQLVGRMPPDQLVKGDMKKESLQLVAKVCLAQAHHCGYLKAEEAMKGKHEMLSKIAMEGAKLYDEAHAMMRASNWFAYGDQTAQDCECALQTARYVFEARASLHLAAKNEAAHEMGDAIGYYIKAKAALVKLPRMPTQAMTLWVNSVVSAANAAHDKAEKANSSVYYARVNKDLPTPDGLPRPMGRPTGHPSFVEFTSKRGEDPFFGIVPAHIASAASGWRDKQTARINNCNTVAGAARQRATRSMQDLGVMSVIQTLSGEAQERGRVPEPLRSSIVNLRGGVSGKTNCVTQTLITKVQAYDRVLEVHGGNAKEFEDAMAEEKAHDAKFLEAYGPKMWRSVCPPADQTTDYNSLLAGFVSNKEQLRKYVVVPMDKAKADLNTNLKDISRLDWNVTDLDALMPFVETKEARQQTGCVSALVERLKEIVAEKEQTENEQMAEQRHLYDLAESDNIVFGLSAVEAGQREVILTKEAQKITDCIERVNAKTRTQDKLVTEAERIMEELSTVRSTDPLAQEIQRVCNGLENACAVYAELVKDFDGILHAGETSAAELATLADSAKSFATARKFQGEELQERLDAQIAAKMSEMKETESEIEASRRRQQQLQAEIQAMQSGQRPPPPQGAPPANAYDAPPTYSAVMSPPAPGYQPPPIQQQQQQQYYQQQPGQQVVYVQQPAPPPPQLGHQYAQPPPPQGYYYPYPQQQPQQPPQQQQQYGHRPPL